MSDEQPLRERYPDFVDGEQIPERIRLIGDLRALGSHLAAPDRLEASMRYRLQREAAGRVPAAPSEVRRPEAEGTPERRRLGALLVPVRRGFGAVGFAIFALTVGAIALWLAAILPGMQEQQPGRSPTFAPAAAATPTTNGRMRAELRRLQPDVPFAISAPTADLSRYEDLRVFASELKRSGDPDIDDDKNHVSVDFYRKRPWAQPLATNPPADRGPDTDEDAPNLQLSYSQFRFKHARSAREQWSRLDEYLQVGDWRRLGKPARIGGAQGRLARQDGTEAQGGIRHRLVWWDGTVFHMLAATDMTSEELLRVARSTRRLSP